MAHLTIENHHLDDLSVLSSCKNLTVLKLKCLDRLTTLSPLCHLPQLKCLTVSYCFSLRSIDGFDKLINLRSLDLRYSENIFSLQGIRFCTELRRLNIWQLDCLLDFSELLGLTKLTHVQATTSLLMSDVADTLRQRGCVLG